VASARFAGTSVVGLGKLDLLGGSDAGGVVRRPRWHGRAGRL